MSQDPQPPVGDPNAGRPPVDPSQVCAPPSPPPGYMPMMSQPEKKEGIMQRVGPMIVSSILLLSILLNVYFYLLFANMFGGSSESVYEEGDEKNRIVILKVAGAISDKTRAFVRSSLEELRENPPRALVLRVDSPGGGLTASDQIDRDIQKFKKDMKIPVVTSFGTVAASGGYYISAKTDYIVSEPTTITGSIGVIAQAFTIEKLLDKVGVTPQVIIADGSKNKSVLDITRPWTDKDKAVLRKFLNTGYDRFTSVVKEGRGDEVDLAKAATGEPFTTAEALDLKLVDEEGYLDDAIDKAKSLAGLPTNAEPQVTVIVPAVPLLTSLTSSTDAPKLDSSMLKELDPETIRGWLHDLATPRLEYRWDPFGRKGY